MAFPGFLEVLILAVLCVGPLVLGAVIVTVVLSMNRRPRDYPRCPQCDEPVLPTASFCANCGAKQE